MYFAQRQFGRITDELAFQLFNLIPQRFKNDEIVIHNSIEQQVGEIVDSQGSDLALTGPQTLPNRIEYVAGSLLK